MGILSHMSTIFKAKVNKILNQLEDPHETLEYSYEKQLELLRNVKRNMADVLASKKRLELQTVKLKENMNRLEEQAKEALQLGREDLARAALERKQQVKLELEGLETQTRSLEAELEKLNTVEARLQLKVEAFRTKKEVIKAQYSAAQAQVKINEAVTGLSEELADVSLAAERAQEKTEKMRARAAALDELIESGVLEETWGGQDPLEKELQRNAIQVQVQEELEKLKREVSQ